jgi:hypothetical protein
MGIKNLNRFLKENCKDSIKMTHFSKFNGKVIVIDTSIYMYKFVSENALIENIYLMLSVFKKYNITPIFVFDGRPPDDKLDLLRQRKADKITAEQEYELLKKNDDVDERRLSALKKQFTYITKKQISDVKTMICALNAQYIEAKGESDEVCAQMVISGQAYAVMSEDMDMFVYGCSNVLRYTSILNHTTVLYDLKGILTELGISQKELREICVLSGTDYSKGDDLHHVLKLFKTYHKQCGDESIGFYIWLKRNGYMTDSEYEDAYIICNRFELVNTDIMQLHLRSFSAKLSAQLITPHSEAKGAVFTEFINCESDEDSAQLKADCAFSMRKGVKNDQIFGQDDIINLLKEEGFIFPIQTKMLKMN